MEPATMGRLGVLPSEVKSLCDASAGFSNRPSYWASSSNSFLAVKTVVHVVCVLPFSQELFLEV